MGPLHPRSHQPTKKIKKLLFHEKGREKEYKQDVLQTVNENRLQKKGLERESHVHV